MPFFLLALAFQMQAGEFDPSQFKPARFAAFEKAEDAEVPKGQIGVDVSMQALMAVGTPTGKQRAVPAEHRDLMTKVGTAVGNPTLNGRVALYTKEVEVVDGPKHAWVAVTDEDAPTLATKDKGRVVDLAVRNLGSVPRGSSREHVYMLINFRVGK